MSTARKQALIFGAGKIGRGFLGHLLTLSGWRITFVDASAELVALLQSRGAYGVKVLGAPEKDATIAGYTALSLAETDALAQAVAEHQLIFTAAGGANLGAVGAAMARGLLLRHQQGARGDVNIIICENYKDPAAILRGTIEQQLTEPDLLTWSRAHLGIAETQVLRSCIEPTPEQRAADPLAVQVQDWWVLPCDAEAFRGQPPEIQGLALRRNFRFELTRKVYTYNCSNAIISFLGWLGGADMLADAAHDPRILEVTRQVYAESGEALIREFGFDRQEQANLQAMALEKYQDRRIADTIERNCRDSRRKLSPQDRLLGPANLAVKHGVQPRHLALAIAAALHYAGSDDPGTLEVQQVLAREGLCAALRQFCALEPDSPLAQLVREQVPALAAYNTRGVRLVTA